MYVLYYASMLQYWHLIWILVRTNHPCLGVGCHTHTHFKILHIESLEKIQKIPTVLQRGTIVTWAVFTVATSLSWPVSTMTILSQ
jgi:hypothetical protein